LRQVVSSWCVLGLTAAAVEAARWIVLFGLLPHDVAFDVAWPSFTAENYRSIPFWERWPATDALTVVTQYFVPVMALALGIAAAAEAFRQRSTVRDTALGVFVPFAFFVLAPLGYLGHIHLVRQYAWCLVPPAVIALRRSAIWLRVPAAVAAAVALVAITKIVLFNGALPGVVPVRMANGDRLWLNEAQSRALPMLLQAAGATQPGSARSTSLALPVGGGLFFYANTLPPTRHLWLIPRYVRPFETESLRAQLAGVRTLLVFDGDVQATVRGTLGEPLSSDLLRRARGSSRVAPGWTVVTLRADANPGRLP
jgi:hypothetical protein